MHVGLYTRAITENKEGNVAACLVKNKKFIYVKLIILSIASVTFYAHKKELIFHACKTNVKRAILRG